MTTQTTVPPASPSDRELAGVTSAAATIRALFGSACDEVQVEGDEPLLLVDPAYAYVTQNAQHQLFCVTYRDGAAVGRREHVALVGAWQLLLALPGTALSNEHPTVLLLSGAAGSQVLRVPVRLLVEAMADGRREQVEPLFDGWIRLLTTMLPQAPVPTRCDPVGPDLVLAGSEAPLRAKSGVVWVAIGTSPSRYGGVRVAEFEETPIHHWPLTETMWIVGGGAAAAFSSTITGDVEWAVGARTSTTAAMIAKHRSSNFADDFYAFVVNVLASQRARQDKARVALDGASRRAERDFVDDALRRLAHVGRGERLAADLETNEPLERVTRKIGAWIDVPNLQLPWPEGPARPSLAKIQTALSRLTRVRVRRVLLEGVWYIHDSGALLGFLLDEGDAMNDERLTPVALVPTSSGYELHDGKSPAPQKVTAELAQRLHPQAYHFYPPLPDRALGPVDVVRFSTRHAARDIAFVLLVGLGLGSLTTLIPFLTGQVFDNLIPGAERTLLLQLTVVLGLIYVGQGLFDLARGLVLVRVQTRMDVSLEAGIWDRLLSLPLPFFREYSAGELASRAAGIGVIRDLLVGTTLGALLGGLFSLWNFVFLFAIDPGLAGAATLLVLVAMVPAALSTYYALKRQRTLAMIDGKIDGLLFQLLNGIAKLRVTAAEDRAFGVWARLFARRRDADLGAERINIRIATFQSVYPIACAMVLYWMVAGAGKPRVSTGLFLAFSTAFGMFLAATLGVVEAGLASLEIIPLYERAKPILSQRIESLGSGERIRLKGEIEVNHVSFRYSAKGPPILQDVSLHIAPDEFVALVGPSGSGKSTLLRLLLGFETPSEGGVFYDGQALTGLDVRAVRKQIGVVMQNSRVMGGDLFTNIVGSTGLTIDDAWQAARNAALDKDIEAMPMGMHTVIAQGGGTLSGGQKQRLLIARSLASDPRIVFFDEATSALDNVTQATVSESLEKLRVTRVVIAHRLSTIRHADKIVVVENGRVVQIGRFEELIAVEGAFKKLASRQMV